jgi:hypothetical protein
MRLPLVRRALLAATAAVLSAPRPSSEHAGAAFALEAPAGLLRGLLPEQSLRPRVMALPRRRLDMDFAVLLMRSSYAVADELDFMSMAEFQKEQFLFRQNEWDLYRQELTVTQGDLADPAYFDFISFCQYASIASGMRRGRQIFEELIDANGTTTIVQRDRSVPSSNAALPAEHSERVGERILSWIDERNPKIAPRVPADGAVTKATLLEGVKQIAVLFEIEDFVLGNSVSLSADGGGITWTLVAPANLWSSQVLRVRGDAPVNDFEVKAVLAYFRRCGVGGVSTSTKVNSGKTQITHEFRWPARLLLL